MGDGKPWREEDIRTEGARTRQTQDVAQMRALERVIIVASMRCHVRRALLARCLSSLHVVRRQLADTAAHDLRRTPGYDPLGLAAGRRRRGRGRATTENSSQSMSPLTEPTPCELSQADASIASHTLISVFAPPLSFPPPRLRR